MFSIVNLVKSLAVEYATQLMSMYITDDDTH